MKEKIRALLSGVLLFVCLSTLGQGDYNPGLPQLITPSPDAASLGKYGEIPVGKYTGTALIGVPVYTINFDGLSIPIGLNYHSGGIKVEELGSWTGLGWSLNAGGIITKTVTGIPDNQTGNGYLNNSFQNMSQVLNLPIEDQKELFMKVRNGQIDLEPDNYYFNFLSYSGRLFIDKNTKTVYTVPKTNLKFNYPLWEVIDANGFKYIFGDGETTSAETIGKSTNNVHTYSATMILKKIISPSGNEITFSYQDYKNLYYTRGNQSKNYILSANNADIPSCTPPGGTGVVSSGFTLNEVMGKRIAEITWDGGKVVFNKGVNNRQDMIGDYALDNIEVYNYQNALLQKHKFYYSSRSVINMPSASKMTELVGNKRMYLDSVKQVAADRDIPPYKFMYHPNFPYYLSMAQDHWGYYNGAVTNPNLLPVIQDGFGFADRNVNSESAKSGTLYKISYPTGGETEFQYESNEALVDACYYMNFLNPNNTNTQAPLLSVTVNKNIREAILNIPISLCNETKKKFTYVVNFPTPINCHGGTKACVGSVQVFLLNTVNSTTINLLNGTFVNGQLNGTLMLDASVKYVLTLEGPGSAINGVSAAVTGRQNPPLFNEKDGIKYINTKVGGLRIAKITNTTIGEPPLITKYYYHDRSNILDTAMTNQRSSGRVSGIGVPIYHYYESMYCGNGAHGENFVKYLTMFSNSLAPLCTDGGNVVGYKMVEEIKEGEGEKIKNITTYTSYDDYPDSVYTTNPFVTVTSFDYMRGLTLKGYALNYNKPTKTYSLLKETSNTYEIIKNAFNEINGLKNACNQFSRLTVYPSSGDWLPSCESGIFRLYKKRSQWYNMISSNEKSYTKNNPSSFMETTTRYFYDNPVNMQLAKMEIVNSKGEIIRKEFKYAHDYASAYPYNAMIQKNIIGPAVESKTTNITNNREMEAQKTIFQQWPSGFIKPSSVEKSISGNILETEVKFTRYSTKGNPLEMVGRDGIINSCIWGYKDQYPVAKISGKSYADAVSQSGIDLNIINNPSTEEVLRTELNKLRNLRDAYVTTYTYKPLVGVTTETDPTGWITYYEYDIFNRLTLVRDNDRNIIRKICYNYAGQPENCTTGCNDTSPDWQDIKTPTRCQLDMWGNNTGYTEQEQADMNPCSPSFKQTRWVKGEYNPDICPAAIMITATNATDAEGYIAFYTNTSSGLNYTLRIPPSIKNEIIGSLPPGVYNLKIYNPQEAAGELIFESGCDDLSPVKGISAEFTNIKVSDMNCNWIKINN